ncbi:MAG: protein TolR [Deltaproteobacteria bacterium]|nr:protein TolR [Deltaproteobacteria bacterium]
MGMSGSGGSGRPVSDINVTPLVDVMLVLLIIFMVTAPLISQGVDVDLPKTKAGSLEGTEKKLVLTLTKDKKIFIGTNADNPIPYEELETKLKNNEKLQQEKELFLHADRHLEYGFVVDVMSTVKNAGVEKLGMVTDPLDQNNSGH